MSTPPPPPEGFEWDRHKAHEKHEKGVSFHEAAETFEDLNSVEFVDDRENYGEQRWVIIGMTKKGRLLTVVCTEREERIRIITAWKSNGPELKKYHERD